VIKLDFPLKHYYKNFILILLLVLFVGWFYYFKSQSTNKKMPPPPATAVVLHEVGAEKERLSQRKTENPNAVATHEITLSANDVDIDKIKQSAIALLSGTEDEQIDAILLLSKVGTPEQKNVIEEYAVDTDKEIAVRLTAAEYMDWEQNSETVAKLLLDKNAVSEAMIYMASAKELSEETRAIIDDTVYSVFLQSPKPSMQIAVLNYFFDQHASQFDELAAQITYEGYTPQDKEEVTNLIKQRQQEKSLTSEINATDSTHDAPDNP
jgi:hypothetical protein